jgi:hypothetical protein
MKMDKLSKWQVEALKEAFTLLAHAEMTVNQNASETVRTRQKQANAKVEESLAFAV